MGVQKCKGSEGLFSLHFAPRNVLHSSSTKLLLVVDIPILVLIYGGKPPCCQAKKHILGQLDSSPCTGAPWQMSLPDTLQTCMILCRFKRGYLGGECSSNFNHHLARTRSSPICAPFCTGECSHHINLCTAPNTLVISPMGKLRYDVTAITVLGSKSSCCYITTSIYIHCHCFDCFIAEALPLTYARADIGLNVQAIPLFALGATIKCWAL